MRWRCKGLQHAAGSDESSHLVAGIISASLMMASSVVGILLAIKIAHAIETMTYTKALDDMEDYLTDAEKAELQRRIRENIFS